MFDIHAIVDAAVETHLWADTFAEDENGELVTADEIMHIDSDMLHHDSRALIEEDVSAFIGAAHDALVIARERYGITDAQIGHDFALTRNGHGAGFWDRGMSEIGEELSEHAREFGEIHGFIDGITVHFE